MKRIFFCTTSLIVLAGAAGVAFFSSTEARDLALTAEEEGTVTTGGYIDVPEGTNIEGVTIWDTEAVSSELDLNPNEQQQQQAAPAPAAA